MPSNDRQTVILPVRLGPVRSYDRGIFPLARFKGTGLLQKGDLLLQATLDEMYNIREMSKGLDSSRTLLREAKRRYDELADERTRLEDLQEQTLYNPFKFYSRFRVTQIFFNATQRLHTATWTTSEKMRRAGLSVVSLGLVDTPAPEEPIAEDEQIEGISIDVDGPVNQQTAAVLAEMMQGMFEVSGNPPADASPSRGEDIAMDQATESATDPLETLSSVRSSVSSPTSPRSAGIGVSTFHYHNYNASVHNYNSTASGINVNNGISSNDNSAHNHVFPLDPLP